MRESDYVDEVNKKLENIDSRVEEIKLDEVTEDFVTKTRKKQYSKQSMF